MERLPWEAISRPGSATGSPIRMSWRPRSMPSGGDMAALAVYPNQGFPADVQARYDAWAAAGNDPLKALVDGTHSRGLEAFFNHRISEVELDGKTFRLKTENPDWVIPTWWPHGMWNLAAPGLQDFKLRNLRYLAENYDFDGLQIDFARHTPGPAPWPAMGTARARHGFHPPGPAHASGRR